MSKNAYLKEMGIDVWVERTPQINSSDVSKNYVTTEKTIEKTSNAIVETEIKSVEISTEAIPTKTEKVNVESLDWPSLQKQVSDCHLCELSKQRTQINFGVGNQSAALMIIADDSNEQSSKLLTSMLKAMGFQRSDTYIINITKCQTLENKDPSQEQAESCEPYLLRQISLVQPKLILTLGNFAAQQVLKSKSTMNRLRGQLHYVDGINAPVLVSYHPTYLLAAPNEKRKAWEDLQLAMEELAK